MKMLSANTARSYRREERVHTTRHSNHGSKHHSMRVTKCHINLLFSIYLFCALLNIVLVPSCSVMGHAVEGAEPILRRTEDISLAQCVDIFSRADTNDDGQMNVGEYLNFVKVISGGELAPTSQTELGLSVFVIFIDEACRCEERGEGNGCCLFGKANVGYTVESQGDEERLVDFCTEVQNELGIEGPIITIHQLVFDVQYSVSNTLGLTSDQIMNEASENTIKSDLIEATRGIIIPTLNSTYSIPSFDGRRTAERIDANQNVAQSKSITMGTENNSENAFESINDQSFLNTKNPSWLLERPNNLRGLQQISRSKRHLLEEFIEQEILSKHAAHPHHTRKMEVDELPDAYYNDDSPIIITTIEDISCPEDVIANCHLVFSSITVFHKSTISVTSVKNVLLDSLAESFKTGAFNDALPL